MKHLIVSLALLAIASAALAADVSISGLNYAEYAYRAAEDSLHNYFYDKLTFRIRYGDITVGQSFIARQPEYKSYSDETIENLSPSDISYDWDERWVSYDTPNMTLHAGTMEETIGRGLVFRSWEDRDFDIDTRMDGAKTSWNNNFLAAKAFYGARPLEYADGTERDETAAGFDMDVKLPYGVTIGGSYVGMKVLDTNDATYAYGDVLIDAGRMGYTSDLFDLYAEYAMMDATKEGVEDREGTALYADATFYVGQFTVLGAYKDYEDFQQRSDSENPMADLPTVNHSGDPLSESGIVAGQDETGYMGEVTWRPDYYSELTVNYAEGWSSDDNYQQADLYVKVKGDVGEVSFTAEYEHLETRDEKGEHWTKELQPQLTADFIAGDFPVTLVAQWEHYDKTEHAARSYRWEPLFQADIAWREISFSVAAEMSYTNETELMDSPVWLGAELALPIHDSTSLRVFGGRQKGGKVCRNGICRQQSEFEGVKLELTTTF